MRRAAKIVAWAAGALIGVPLLVVAGLLAFANTGAGRAAFEALVAKASSGEIALQGFTGRFPDRLRAARVELRDRNGTWLAFDDVTLRWSPLRLLAGEADIETLAASHAVLARFPASEERSSGSLRLRVALAHLDIGRLDLAAPVAGAPAAVHIAGSLHLASALRGDIALEIERLDAPGRYKIEGRLAPEGIAATFDATEPAQGLLARLARLPDLGALSIAARLSGPRNAEQVSLAAAVGALRADGQGTIDLVRRALDIDLVATAAAMAPRPDLSWRSARLDLHLHGPFASPDAAGRLAIDDLAAAGATVGQVAANLRGSRGKIELDASLGPLHLPGPNPDLFGATPIALHAEAALDTPTRPVAFSLTHPLLSVSGTAETARELSASLEATLPQLAPFAALAGIDAAGRASLAATIAQRGDATHAALDGTLDLTGGAPLAAKVLGLGTKLALAATLHGDAIVLDRAAIEGRAGQASAHGTLAGGVLDLTWGLTLADVADLVPTLSGPLSAEGTLTGPRDNLALTLESHGELAAAGLPRGAIDAAAEVEGLPAHPAAHVDVHGRLAGAPLVLVADLRRDRDGTAHFALNAAQWKSIDAHGDLILPAGAIFPLGHLQLRAARLADLAPLLGVPLAGSVDATLDTDTANGRPEARLHAAATRLAGFNGSIEDAMLDATVKDALARPVATARLALAGISAHGVTGSARLDAAGPADALSLRLSCDLATPRGPAHLAGTAIARLSEHGLRLATLRADYAGEAAQLTAPARFRFAKGLSVDRFRAAIGGAVLTVAGSISPELRLSVSLEKADAGLVKPIFPGIKAAGSVSLEAKLAGSLAAPAGTIHIAGRGLRVESGPGSAMPAADLDATATLRGSSARVDARLTAGAKIRLHIAGAVPLDAAAKFDLHGSGTADLALLDPLLAARGRSVRGEVTLDLGLAGTLASPRLSGSIRVADGSVQDFTQGIHVTAIDGNITAAGDTLRIAVLTGKAGAGTLAIAGTIGVLAPGMPIDLAITARNARPLASDRLTATLDADLTLRGALAGPLTLAGRIHVSRAEIHIPDRLPLSVAILEVQRPGQASPPAVPPAAPIMLDLAIDAPQQIFVRGHGLDAEMGGRLELRGSSDAPQIAGGFDLRRGTYNLAGQTLNFTSGRIAFDGFGLAGRLDPTLDFVAESNANGVTATLRVTGYADAPRIRLSSTPALPQDEILAQLLFGASVKQLTPFQVVAVAQAIAAISGVGGASDPLAGVRRGLGLDRLSVGAASGNRPGATVEAGKYVASGIYVGTKQGTSGGTQAQVQIDLTKHLKLESTIGRGGVPATGATPDNDPGSSLGLSWQFQY